MLKKTLFVYAPPLPSADWYEGLVDTKEAAALIGLSPATLATDRSRGGLDIPFIKAKRLVRYRRRTLLEWADARQRRNTSDIFVNRSDGAEKRC